MYSIACVSVSVSCVVEVVSSVVEVDVVYSVVELDVAVITGVSSLCVCVYQE